MCYNNNKSFFPYEQAFGLYKDGKSENFQLVEVRFMLVSAAEMLKKAKAGHYAVGQFNINNLEWTKAALLTAEECKSPIILGVSEGAGKYMTGFKTVADMTKAMIEELNITVPVALHLDHGTYDGCYKCIKAGFSSIMFDGSHYPIEENVEKTKELAGVCKGLGLSLEAEVGSIGGAEEGVVVAKDDAMYTKPEDALYFAENTGVDALAVSIGTTHGQYKSKAKINYELLAELKAKLGDTGLVLHGGTGVSDEDMRRCVREGMKKINVGTELNKSYIEVVRETFTGEDVTPLTSLRNLLGPANDKVADVVKEKASLFRI